MISVTAVSRARLMIISSNLSVRRRSNSCYQLVQRQRHHLFANRRCQQQQRPHSSFRQTHVPLRNSNGRISKPPTTTTIAKRNNRSLSSSPSSPPPAPPSSKPSGDKKKTKKSVLVPNVVLGTALFGFVTGVFLYSMNAVGAGPGGGGDALDDDDPLAQLKAEAQEAIDHRSKVEGGSGRMSPDEIRALESGLVGTAVVDGKAVIIDNNTGERTVLEVAVAAPADIAALEEEANLKIFRQTKQQTNNDDEKEGKKKKSWWRFGF